MYRKDFILRMMDMLAEMVAGILGLIKKGNYNEASQALENAFQELLKKDMSFFLKIPCENLISELLENHNYTNDHLEVLSELFFAQAELEYSQANKNESLIYNKKSLRLLDFVMNESDTFSLKRQARIEQLKMRIEEVS